MGKAISTCGITRELRLTSLDEELQRRALSLDPDELMILRRIHAKLGVDRGTTADATSLRYGALVW